VGIDPHAALLRAWGFDDDVAGLERWTRTAVEALAGTVAAVKPQSAFFERFGSRGVAVLETVIAETKAAGALVIGDVKRSDIGSTMDAYAQAYLDPTSPLGCDAMTVSPYLGVGALRSTFDYARKHGNGVFVLVLTSNPEGREVQDARVGSGTLAQHVIDQIGAYNIECATEPDSLGSIGAVIGATIGRTDHAFSRLHGPFLAPGLGAQGATAADLPVVFGPQLRAVLPTVSRTVLQAGPNAVALQQAAVREIAACASARDQVASSIARH
jgi:orotidine-5'-phosphate decarboxylase